MALYEELKTRPLHTFPALAFPVLTYGLKKSNSSSDVRGVCQSNEVIHSEVEHTPEDFIGRGNNLAENLAHLAPVEKQEKEALLEFCPSASLAYWEFLFSFSIMHQNVFNLDVESLCP